MPDILPEPDETNEVVTPLPSRKMPRFNGTPKPRQTIAVLVSLVILAALALIASYIYDDVNNNDQNNTRKQDISYIAGEVNGYHSLYGSYPTLSYLNSSTFAVFAPSLNRTKFKDPTGSSELLSANVTSGRYAYQPAPAGCNNVALKCSSYKLTAVLTNGSDYVVTSASKS